MIRRIINSSGESPQQTTQMTKATINEFVARLNNKFSDEYKFSVTFGGKNARVIYSSLHNDTRYCYCFVRIADGAVLKSASWKSPAGVARAWLTDVMATNLEGVDSIGGWRYRCLTNL